MKQMFDPHSQGQSIRTSAATLGLPRNTVRKCLRAPEIPKPAPKGRRLYRPTVSLPERLCARRSVDNSPGSGG